MTDAATGSGAARRAIAALVFAAVLVVVAVYYIRATVALATLTRAGTQLLGAPIPSKTSTPGAQPGALAANPLTQQAVSGVMALRLQQTGDRTQALRDAVLLRQLGWRSTSALQNLLWRAGTTQDLPLMMDTLDALLRRERMLAQLYPLLNLMTTDPVFRDLLTRRLAGRPPWRRYYFQSASDLSRPREIEGRFLVMSAIQGRGDRLARNEVAPIMPKLIDTGRSDQAFALWQANQSGKVTSPLADTDFSTLATTLPGDALPVPFEWQLGSGVGYFADTGRDKRGAFMSIDWNGRGTPSFASQTTSARAGRYRLDVTGDGMAADLAKRIGFQLLCSNREATILSPVATVGNRLRLMSEDAVPCDYPKLELVGLIQPSSAGGSVMIRRIKLERVSG